MFKWLRSPPRRTASLAPRTTWVQEHVLEVTAQVLSQSGWRGEQHEGVVYWAGRAVGREGFVMNCIAPAARTTYGSFATTSQTNARVVMYLAKFGLELLGQVHSHPGTLVDHSDGDDEKALMPYEGFLSIVVPTYAQDGLLPVTSCGVHVFEKGRFRRLDDSEVKERLRVVPGFADLRI